MPRRSWRAALATYANPATLVLLILGFAAGLPYMLVFSTLSVWLREAGVSHQTIGYASLIGLAYAFKWVWSPMLDQWRLPVLGRLGRRRSWLILSQVLVAGGLLGMALIDPREHLSWLIAVAVVVAFASATQDIAIDAYRLEIADDTHQAALAASYMAGYRVSALLATAGALYFAGWFGSTGSNYSYGAWAGTYALFALLMLPGLLTCLWMREPAVSLRTQRSAARYGLSHQLVSVLVLIILLVSLPAFFTQLLRSELFSSDFDLHQLLLEDRAFLRALLYGVLTGLCLSSLGRRGLAPVLTPVNDFVVRYRWQALALLGLIATYRLSDTVMGVMANVFYIDQGYTKEQIASISKLFGLLMTLFGAGLGGVLIVRFGILPILFIVMGLGENSKIALIVIGTLPCMIRDLAMKVQELPREQIVKAQTLGASTWQIALRVAMPQTLPRLIDVLRLQLGPAWLFLIAAEAIASDSGLGYRIFLVRRYLAMDVIIPYVAWITLLAFLIDVGLRVLQRRAFPWFASVRAE